MLEPIETTEEAFRIALQLCEPRVALAGIDCGVSTVPLQSCSLQQPLNIERVHSRAVIVLL